MAPVSPPDDPLSDEGLERLFSSLSQASGILVAVSGGPDSMALMHGLARWASLKRRPPIHVATVDHGLRPEAAEEAAFVAREAALLSLPHRTLAWTGQKPATGIQEAARETRYGLLVEHARERGASHLVTAHTLDDQAETVMMRLSRGSGLSGLAGMRLETDRHGIRHVRPLLGVPKSRLLDQCRQQGWRFVTDPSNADERYARVRWRKLMPLLAAEGLTAERLARLAERAAQADEALDLKAREALDRAEPLSEAGTLSFHARALTDEPFDIALRVLELALAEAGMDLDNSRLYRLEACTERLRQAAGGGEALSLTIVGAHLRLTRAGRVSVGPEPPRHRGR
ncbi:tRNA lysidine(34) synthetase TilS [Microvirga sp. CF3062]|uniref:tRNA lysidine(34) synthetase TilS n=1 Tax=Microvirga sp. CF3062 TaxID=3110182 RepID=UPI002E784F44|nr:tRNA lysidine(34) synthetase TilS [Microvirga sp. CF3062]MEE1657574.1 tRNA lysidine(34) synthetase TilS [Microvirga sp. CF3062]